MIRCLRFQFKKLKKPSDSSLCLSTMNLRQIKFQAHQYSRFETVHVDDLRADLDLRFKSPETITLCSGYIDSNFFFPSELL